MNFKIFIDCDGVILDTWDLIYSKYQEVYKITELDDNKLLKVMDDLGWYRIINDSEVINDSINKIKELSKKYDVTIVTKVVAEDEKKEKDIFFKKNGLDKVVYVSYEGKKIDKVLAKGNILIDDTVKNLDEWNEEGGISIFFNRYLNNKDGYNKENTKYKMIDDINKIYDTIELLERGRI